VIIFRYLSREILSVTTAVCIVLLMVLISGRFVKYLANALAGNMDPEVIFAVIGYRIPGFLELTLPLAFFLAILLTFGRLYVENEMSVLKACGISELKLLTFALIIASFLAVLVGWLSLVISPAGVKKAETIFAAQEERSELDRLTAKKFYSLRGGKGVAYVESLTDNRQLNEIFLAFATGSAESSDRRLVAVIADRGKQQITESEDERFLILKQGYRVEGVPGSHDYQVTYFDEYGARLEPPEELSEDSVTDAMPSSELLASSRLEHRAALQWRVSIPIMMLVVTMLAVPLSRIDPRAGRFARVLPAVLLYFVYLVSLNAMRGAIEAGKLPIELTLLPVHLLFLVLALVMLNSEKLGLLLRSGVALLRRGEQP